MVRAKTYNYVRSELDDMSEEFEITLSDGRKVVISPEDPESLFGTIVKKVLIPFYKDSNDWNASIRKAINVMDYIRRTHNLPELDYRQKLLEEIEDKLGQDIAELEGVDKIEILFLNLDDYTEEIATIMTSADLTKEEKIRALGSLIATLNTFEMSELLFHYVQKTL